jgi:hypothetical protein
LNEEWKKQAGLKRRRKKARKKEGSLSKKIKRRRINSPCMLLIILHLE